MRSKIIFTLMGPKMADQLAVQLYMATKLYPKQSQVKHQYSPQNY
jgi:hypothetical protein